MSDEVAVEYKGGDVVWVKLGSRWWPGEVKEVNSLPSEVVTALKKTPLVVVKFFDEDSYEFVKNWSNIYPYNCEKKNDFIKRGMDAFRAKQTHMEKFPKDVCTAEVRTDGNPNILSDPIFAPEKKTNYSALFFGTTPSPKKAKDQKKGRPSTGKNQNTKRDTTYVTHRRFLGQDDYEAHIRIQYPGRDRENSMYSSDEEMKEPPKETKKYTCTICKFITDCLEVIVLHNTSHIQGVYKPVTTLKKPKKSIFKKVKAKSQRTKSGSDVTAEESTDDDNELEKTKVKRKRKSQIAREPKQRKMIEEKPRTSTDIRSDLLAEWDDVSDNEAESTLDVSVESTDPNETTKLNESIEQTEANSSQLSEASVSMAADEDASMKLQDESVDSSENDSKNDSTDMSKKPVEESQVTPDPIKPKHDLVTKKSCFDFDEDEEETVGAILSTTSTGRKIPRVIPITEKRVSLDLEDSLPAHSHDSTDEQSTASSAKDEAVDADQPKNSSSVTPASSETVEKEGGRVGEKQNEDEIIDQQMQHAFNELLESTVVPDLPDVPNTLKCEQNFHCAKTIKFPDKTEPSKFDDLKSGVAKTVESTTNVATKLTNPKKRFVKSFEDFEQLQNEQKRIAQEEKKDVLKTNESVDSTVGNKSENNVVQSVTTANLSTPAIDFEYNQSEIKSDPVITADIADTLKSKVSETTNKTDSLQNKVASPNGSPVKFSRLKTQIMSKIQTNEQLKTDETAYDVLPKVRRLSASHRTPRSKILESYRNEHLAVQIPISALPQNFAPLKETTSDLASSSATTSLSSPVSSNVDSQASISEKNNLESDDSSKESEYCLKKRKYSKLSKALAKQNEDSHPVITEGKSATATEPSKEEKIDVCTSSTVSNSGEETISSLKVVNDIIQDGKPAEDMTVSTNIPNDSVRTDEVMSTGAGSIIADESTGENDTKLKAASDIQNDVSGGEKQPDTVTNQDNLSCSEMEKLFSDENKKFSEEIKSNLASDGKHVTAAKPEFSSTSELMMELADGEKSSSADEDLSSSAKNVAEGATFVDNSAKSIHIDESTISSDVTKGDNEDKLDEAPSLRVPLELQPEIEQKISVDKKIEENDMDLSQEMHTSEATETESLDTNVKDKYSNGGEINNEMKSLDLKMHEKYDTNDVADASPSTEQLENNSTEKIETDFTSVDDVSMCGTAHNEEVVSKQDEKQQVVNSLTDVSEKTNSLGETSTDNGAIKQNSEPIDSGKSVIDQSSTVGIDTTDLNTVANSVVSIDSKTDMDSSTPTSGEPNVVHFKYAPDKDDAEFDISIKTNLTNFSNNDELSALTTLATVSQLKDNLETNQEEKLTQEPEPVVSDENQKLSEPCFALGPAQMRPDIPITDNNDTVTVDGNLTVVSEKDLADGQVEIATSATKNPVTLTNFSLDFSDSNSNSGSFSSYHEPHTDLKTKSENKAIKFDTKASSVVRTLSQGEPHKDNKTNPLHKYHDGFPKRKSKIVIKEPTVLDAVCDLEEHIPPQIVCAKDPSLVKLNKDKPKFLNTELPKNDSGAKKIEPFGEASAMTPVHTGPMKSTVTTTLKEKSPKFIIKSRVKQSSEGITEHKNKSNKPIILSEKIIKPVADAESVSVQKISSKHTFQDVEDIDTFIIQKSKKPVLAPAVSDTKVPVNSVPSKPGGKAKILQQTIITAAGEIIQPNMTQADDNVFDINSMPIVLSDDILTPESIEKMPIVISDSLQSEPVPEKPSQKSIKKSFTTQPQVSILNKSVPQSTVLQTALTRSIAPSKVTKTAQKFIQTTTGRVIKHTPSVSGNKTGKYIILPQSSTVQDKIIVGKKQFIKKNQSVCIPVSQSVTSEPMTNKIMIVTNQQGQKQRLLLTPTHQKLLASQGSRITKTVVKGNITQKSVLAPKSGQIVVSTSGSSAKNVLLGTSTTQILTPVSTTNTVAGHLGVHSNKNIKIDLKTGRKVAIQTQRTSTFQMGKGTGQQKTVLLKNQHGQTIRKFQNTDEALLEKQVAEQLQAIKASGLKAQQKPEILNYKNPVKTTIKRSYSKRQSLIESPKQNVTSMKIQSTNSSSTSLSLPTTSESSVPPLTPFTQKKDQLLSQDEAKQEVKKPTDIEKKLTQSEVQRPLNQLVIQDAMGNQTTITEGQILALPSETVDGQPQSYMLVTLDESGNLTPLNSEALMSLDPNLNLGGDLSNMVLQIDHGAMSANAPEGTPQTATIAAKQDIAPPEKAVVDKKPAIPAPVANVKTSLPNTSMKTVETIASDQPIIPSESQPITCHVGGDPGQQLIVTGDPVATQKFLESLSEGTTDLANIFANAEGGSILIHADGQQILINTEADNQNLLLSVNPDTMNMTESSEGGGNPIFATQPKKSKDILAAALAGTDVFQQEQNSVQNKVVQSQLSPNSSLYPMNVGNVLEPTLTLSSPIMTPLEVPSTNNKKIADDEADILTQVPKNVDLPITITDPNISQTVSQQQVASMIANELQGNLELPLPISDGAISVASSEMSSPSFVYALPTFDDTVDITPKSFNSSMPLLTEDSEDVNSHSTKDSVLSNSEKSQQLVDSVQTTSKTQSDKSRQFELQMQDDMEVDNSSSSDKIRSVLHSDGSLMEEEGLCTLGGEMCTSLSEPPPDMFELDTVNTSFAKETSNIPEKVSSDIESKNVTETTEAKEISTTCDSLVDTVEAEDVESKHQGKADSTSIEAIQNEDSCEIPILPPIVTDLSSEQSVLSSDSDKKNMMEGTENDNL